MKAPICNACLKSSELCAKCKGRLEKGNITELDVEVSRLLYELSGEFKALKDIELKKTIFTQDLVIFITKKGDAGALIGKGGKIVKTISQKMDKKVKVIEESGSYKEIIRDILSPIKVLGINILFLPDGDEHHRVIISKQDISKLPGDPAAMENIIKELTGRETVISFE